MISLAVQLLYVLTSCSASKERNVVNPRMILFVSSWEALSLQLVRNFTETVQSLVQDFIEIVF